MRTLLALAVAATLSGCIIVAAPPGGDYAVHTPFSSSKTVEGDGVATRDVRQVAALTGLDVGGSMIVEVRVGAAPSLVVEGDSNLVHLVQTETRGSTLRIGTEGRLRSMVFWMIGDLAGAPVRLLPWLVLGGAPFYALAHARGMNVMALHAEAAVTLGVHVGSLRRGLFFISGVLTASAVTSAGSIGFVGLIVPHACRFAFGPDHRVLIPAAVLAGGSFLVLCDTLARTVVAPQQLPVGAVTALIGAPVFLYQLHRLRRS